MDLDGGRDEVTQKRPFVNKHVPGPQTDVSDADWLCQCSSRGCAERALWGRSRWRRTHALPPLQRILGHPDPKTTMVYVGHDGVGGGAPRPALRSRKR